jgi:hypothetical protein
MRIRSDRRYAVRDPRSEMAPPTLGTVKRRGAGRRERAAGRGRLRRGEGGGEQRAAIREVPSDAERCRAMASLGIV